jgi:SAM-dependent methyltransferase
MRKVDRIARKFALSLAVLSRNKPLMAVLDAFDRGISLPFPEFRNLPPNRFRIRTGLGNRVLFNQAVFVKYGYDLWLHLLNNFITLSDHVVDIGSGCGRFAYAVRDHTAFTGLYTGIDVDLEMVTWCQKHFPTDRFTFVHANTFNNVYNPSGSKDLYRLPLENDSADLVCSQSLFTHLLESDLKNYVAESYRVLRKGKVMAMSCFCIEDLQDNHLLGGGWPFKHRVQSAFVENLQYPEAAVGYPRDFLIKTAREAGFLDCRVDPAPFVRRNQSVLVGRK